MPSWNELLKTFDQTAPDKRQQWLDATLMGALRAIRTRRGGRNVILCGSAFLQKPQAPAPFLSITFEDINALMTCIHGMDCSKGLTLILHTPGGATNATETVVAYLRSKFHDVEVAVPTYAMSAGTMISLGSNRVIMGRQSQLGPIDPQFSVGARNMSARAVVDQFEIAKTDILGNQKLAHAWAPILQTIGPSLLKEALDALDYSKDMVRRWLESYMLSGDPNASTKATAIAEHFSDTSRHKSHGRRISRDEARAHGVVVEDLENDQALQDAVLTAYHLFTIIVEKSPATKVYVSDAGQAFVKSWTGNASIPSP